MRFVLSYVLVLFFLAFSLAKAQGANNSVCNVTISLSNRTYILNQKACASFNIIFALHASDNKLVCDNVSFGKGTTIKFAGLNTEDYLFNCSFNRSRILLGNESFADLISPKYTNFTAVYSNNSSITVGYLLNISVFEPFGSNSTSLFGNRIAAFGYIIPLFNNSIHINNTELQMQPSFSSGIVNLISRLNKTMQFGVYNQNQTAIYFNFTRKRYGNIFGSKVFMVPAYSLTRNGMVNYNPYAIEYSFISYDQLVMYFLNITRNTNLTPVYIAPVYPKFNYYILPDNGKRNMTIKWLVAVPPQDANWNFSAYIYRYSTALGFVMNPLNTSIANGTYVEKLLSFPSSNANGSYANGTYVYYLSYRQKTGIGLNSSIILMPGRIPGEGKFIQDSTTPSFSYGLGFCSTQFNSTRISSIIDVSGTYTMVSQLFPVSQTAPVLVHAPCYIGAYITGKNITINCNNGTINALYYGFVISNATNVSLYGCRIFGNGIKISNSTHVSITNTEIIPTNASSANGLSIYNSSHVYFADLKIFSGFSSPYTSVNSVNVSFYNSNISFKNETTTTIVPAPGIEHKAGVSQTLILYFASAVLAVVYIYLFFRLQYKSAKRNKPAKNR